MTDPNSNQPINQSTNQLEEVVKQLLSPGKGILAADESTHTIEKRFASLGLTSTPELNCKYRTMLVTSEGIENFISGVIMFDETIRQSVQGKPFTEYLIERGIVSGIKVDEGLESFNGTEEKITKGIENLSERLIEYSKLGLKFTKWRMAIKISDIFPSKLFLEESLERMTEFAALSQKNGLVPIVEPEVLLDGNHTTTRCAEITTEVLKFLFEKLNDGGVDLKLLLLKTSMVLPGKENGIKAEPLEVANATLRTLKKSVPPEVPGIVFLSGGQTPDEAMNNLNEIVKLKGDSPWELTFSFGRALQEEAMSEWKGLEENVNDAQKVFFERARRISLARKGEL